MSTAITPLANVTLSSATSTVTFSSISGLFRDLYCVITPLAATTGGGVTLRFNGDTGTNYDRVVNYGNGSSAGSGATNGNSQGYFGADSSGQSVIILQVMDYTATNKHKDWIARHSQVDGWVSHTVGNWSNTSAITSLQIRNDSQNFSIGATFALYGVSA